MGLIMFEMKSSELCGNLEVWNGNDSERERASGALA